MLQKQRSTLSTVMTRAWKMFKNSWERVNITFSDCLKAAWRKVKSATNTEYNNNYDMSELSL